MKLPWVVIAGLFVCMSVTDAPAVENAKLTGDVLVTMQSGDVKRGADVLVTLVTASSAFMKEWDYVQGDYEEEVAPVIAEFDKLNAQYKSVQVLDQMIALVRSRWVRLRKSTSRPRLRWSRSTPGPRREQT